MIHGHTVIDGDVQLQWSRQDNKTSTYLSERVQFRDTVYSDGVLHFDMGSNKYLMSATETVQGFQVAGDGSYLFESGGVWLMSLSSSTVLVNGNLMANASGIVSCNVPGDGNNDYYY